MLLYGQSRVPVRSHVVRRRPVEQRPPNWTTGPTRDTTATSRTGRPQGGRAGWPGSFETPKQRRRDTGRSGLPDPIRGGRVPVRCRLSAPSEHDDVACQRAVNPSGERGLGLPAGPTRGPRPGAVPDDDTPGCDAAGLRERVTHERPEVTANLRLAAVRGVEHHPVDGFIGDQRQIPEVKRLGRTSLSSHPGS